MSEEKPRGKGCSGCLGISLIIFLTPIVALAGFVYFASANLRRSDEAVLKDYQASEEVADVAAKNTLADKGKATFYRSEPTFVNSQDFIKYCQQSATGVDALACNAPKPGGGPFGGRQIFILKIDDPKFADHKYSAAVHEMLHSAYQRLETEEKKRLSPLLLGELEKHKDDLHLAGVVEIVKARGEEATTDELHAKFGVEYADISPELEDYYKQYFVNRAEVVKLYQNGGFNSRVRRMDEINYELKVRAARLNALDSQLKVYQKTGDVANFNRLVGEYNSLVTQYNARVRESQKVYKEIETFYKYFNPNYQPPAAK